MRPFQTYFYKISLHAALSTPATPPMYSFSLQKSKPGIEVSLQSLLYLPSDQNQDEKMNVYRSSKTQHQIQRFFLFREKCLKCNGDTQSMATVSGYCGYNNITFKQSDAPQLLKHSCSKTRSQNLLGKTYGQCG